MAIHVTNLKINGEKCCRSLFCICRDICQLRVGYYNRIFYMWQHMSVKWYTIHHNVSVSTYVKYVLDITTKYFRCGNICQSCLIYYNITYLCQHMPIMCWLLQQNILDVATYVNFTFKNYLRICPKILLNNDYV